MSNRFRILALIALAALAASAMGRVIPLRSISDLLESTLGGSAKPVNEREIRLPATVAPPMQTGGDAKLSLDGQFTIYQDANGEIVCRIATRDEKRGMADADLAGLGMRPINHLDLLDKTRGIQPSAAPNLTIVLRATQQLQQNPTAVAAFTKAAQNWEDIIKSPVTIYIDVDYGPTRFGQSWPGGVLGATSAPSGSYPYQSVRNNLIAEANGEGNATKQAIFNALPGTTVPTDLGDATSTGVSDPAARAIGLLPATAQSTDNAAKIAFNSNFTFDFDPSDGITADQIDFDAVATHEIGHALGFDSDAGSNLPKPSVWDLYRFRTGVTTNTFTAAQRIVTIGGSPDPLQFYFVPGNAELGLSTGGPAGSSSNGGDGWQSSHWKHVTGCSPSYIGIMDPAIPSGCRRTITGSDILALTSFGYNLTNNNPPPAPPAPPPAPANDNFANAQTINSCSGFVTGTSFSATSESGEPSHDPSDATSLSPSHTVWYQWQAPSAGSVTMTTAGSDFDTILAVYTGSTVGGLSRLVFNDDVQSGVLRTSTVTFNGTAGTVYRIAIDGWGGDQGGIKLNWFGCGAPTPTPTPTPSPTPGACPGSLIVNDNGDAADAGAGNGVCATAAGTCTLRAAIQEANALPSCGPINIILNGGPSPIVLSTALPDINHNVNIIGPGANQLTVMRSAVTGTPAFGIIGINSGRTVAISGITISNGIGNPGGGVRNNGTLLMTGCNIYGNSVVLGQVGAGIYSNGTILLNNCNLGGTAPGQANSAGAGAGYYGASLAMNGGSVVGNDGVGLTLTNGPNALDGVTIANNSGRLDGGGLDIWGFGTTRIFGCLVANNSATRNGGGINTGSGLVLVNSTISSNRSAGAGGGISGGPAQMTNVTVSNNRSDFDNSGAETGGGISGGLTLNNSLVAANFRGSGTTADDIAGTVSASSAFNLIGTGGSGGLVNGINNNKVGVSNPSLGILTANGGPTMTHALLAGSPAINAGSNALAVDQSGNALTTDQRGVGFARIMNGTVDIGAFEVQTVVPPCLDDLWTATNTSTAPAARRFHSAIWTGTEMIVWGGQDGSIDLNTGARYNPATDSWTPISTTNAPAARSNHTAVWTGSEMIVWGGQVFGSGSGYMATGARYNPSTDVWTPISNVNAPVARTGHTAVWTGTEMIVWGGQNNTGIQTNGGKYNPATDTWTSVSTMNAPAARGSDSVVWTGSEMIVWGGAGGAGLLNSGGRYNPINDTWTATNTANAPEARAGHTAVWTGTEMIVWGGGASAPVSTGGRYNPITDSWTATNTANAPEPRTGHNAVWIGTEMIVWGGGRGTNERDLRTNGRYNPATNTWILTCDTNVPVGRVYSTAVWTGGQMVVWGGEDSGLHVLNSGGRYSIPGQNSIDYPIFFVRRHYLDFLNREPDQSGWNFWTNQITSCGTDVQCLEVRRTDVSASFFLSIEFQQSGYLVERIYKVAYGDAIGTSTFGSNHQLSVPVVRFSEFLQGTQRIGQGLIVLAPGWEQLLENNKQAFALEFVQTSRFINAFPTTMTPTEFVGQLNTNAGNVLSAGERATLINLFGGAANSSNTTARGQSVRMVAEDTDLYNAEYNRAFVLAEYYGYLRRNPNDAPESTLDYTGYDFWLTKLNQFNGNYINAEMVKAFLSSIEYRKRFGP